MQLLSSLQLGQVSREYKAIFALLSVDGKVRIHLDIRTLQNAAHVSYWCDPYNDSEK